MVNGVIDEYNKTKESIERANTEFKRRRAVRLETYAKRIAPFRETFDRALREWAV